MKWALIVLLILSAIYQGTVVLAQNQPTLNFILKSYETRYTDPVSLAVRLLDSEGLPVSGVTINFYLILDSTQMVLLGSAPTNDSGIAEITVNIDRPPGAYKVNATCNYEGYDLEASAELIVYKELTKIIMNQNLTIQYTDNISFSVWVLTDDNEPVPNAELKLVLFVGSYTLEFYNYSDDDGEAVFTIQAGGQNYITVGDYDFVVSFDGNDYYEGSSLKNTLHVKEEKLIVQVSTIGKIVVGASIVLLVQVMDDDGTPVNFAEVRIFIDGEIVGVGKTNSQGIYEYSWTPSTPGNHTIYVVAMKNYYTNASYELTVIVEGGSSNSQTPSLFIAILIFLIIAVVIAYISRR